MINYLCYAEQFSVMPLSWAVTKKKENYMGAITWKLYIWGSLSRDDFPCDYYLRVIISGQLFCGTDWVQIFFGTIIRRSNYQGGYCPGDNCSGGNGDQLSRGQLSSIVPLCGVWKYQTIIIWHHIIYHLTCCPKLQTRKILTSHFFSFFYFKKWNVVFNFSICSHWKTFCKIMCSEKGFVEQSSF